MSGALTRMLGRTTSATDTLADLFAGGEIGDWWRFDNVHTNQTSSGGNITTATGVVNGRVMTNTGGPPTLELVSGIYVMHTNATSGCRMIHSFGSTIAQPGTLILCVGDTGAAAHAIATGSSTTLRWQISVDGSNNLIAFAGSTLDSTINTPVGTKVLAVEFNGASSKYRVNGTQTAAATTGTQSTNQLTLGAIWDGTFPSITNFYSALFINRLLTGGAGGELDRAERLLGSHAGLSW